MIVSIVDSVLRVVRLTFRIADKKLLINGECMGCGVCVNNCEKNAMYLERDTAKRELLEIKPLLKEVSN